MNNVKDDYIWDIDNEAENEADDVIVMRRTSTDDTANDDECMHGNRKHI